MKRKQILIFFMFIVIVSSPLFTEKLQTATWGSNSDYELLGEQVENQLKFKMESLKPLINAEMSDESYLIITVSDYVDEFAPLVSWKQQKGYNTYVETITNINNTYSGIDLPERMRNCIHDYYENKSTAWVLLGGDSDEVPTRLINVNDTYQGSLYDGWTACDSYFADLDHDWNYVWENNQSNWLNIEPEVYVGRLSGNAEDQMEMLVSNIITYETNPHIGDWMDKGLFAGSMLYFDEDWDNDSSIDYGRSDSNYFNNYLANQLLPQEIKPHFMGEEVGVQPTNAYYDEAIDKFPLYSHLKNGSSIGVIGGHANPTMLVRTTFDTDVDGDGLYDRDGSLFEGGTPIDSSSSSTILHINDVLNQENDTLGLYVLDGCSAGEFDYNVSGIAKDCLSEWMLKSTAIGCVAGHNIVWGEDEWYEREHGGWFMEGFTYRFFEQLMQDARPGKAIGLAKADQVEDRKNISLYEENNFIGWEEKILKQMNLLGDPEVNIWLGQPSNMEYEVFESMGDFNINVNDITSNIPEAMVTFTNDTDLIWAGKTDENGNVAIPDELVNITTFTLTVTHPGNLPIIVKADEFLNLNIISNFNPDISILSMVYTQGDYHSLSFIATLTDDTVNSKSYYNVSVNGVFITEKDSWIDEEEYTYRITYPTPGIYTIVIEAFDGLGGYEKGEKTKEIVDDTTDDDTTDDDTTDDDTTDDDTTDDDTTDDDTTDDDSSSDKNGIPGYPVYGLGLAIIIGYAFVKRRKS